jgi:glycosyltransferase involved in cell wall biosynthesis
VSTANGPRVLFLAPVEPWARENGSSLIIADQLEGLARAGHPELLPIFLRHPPAGFSGVAPDGMAGIQMCLEGMPRWASIAKALVSGSSPMLHRFAIGRVTRLLEAAAVARGFRPTVVHVEHLPLVLPGLRLGARFSCPVVYRSHNIEAVLIARRSGMPGPAGRIIVKQSERAEAEAIRACAMTLCISDVDLAWVRGHAPEACAEVLPCALLMERYAGYGGASRAEVKQIGFVGGLDWPPNELGLRWFVEEVLPLVSSRVPAVRLAILSRGAARRSWLSGNPLVRILPEASDARDIFSSSLVSIAPLLQGGGVRIKIPESLAMGCPVVATRIGAEGHELPGLSTADDPTRFADACVKYLVAPPDAGETQHFRGAVEARHGAVAIAERLTALWDQAARSRSGG